jgi:Animal haem peroxidase
MAHGSSPNFELLAPRSRLYQGSYGRLCPELPPWIPPGETEDKRLAFLRDFANLHMIEAPGESPEAIASDSATGKKLRRRLTKFNSRIPAGYTYFGQFVDHDITFDPTPLETRRIDPNGLLNFRTPRLDLDSVYGRGSDDQPYLYDQRDAGKFFIGKAHGSRLRDLPRNSPPQSRALIGDMRNDENAIVSQIHLAFLLAHNALVHRARDEKLADPFEAARRTLRWLYQFVVWHDFVKRITDATTHERALGLVKDRDGSTRWVLGTEDVYEWKKQPFIPVEFSAAAYRFGHSMVANEYQTNEPFRHVGKFAPLFESSSATHRGSRLDDLSGKRELQTRNVIQWNWFLKMKSPAGFPQVARKIDTKLANALAYVPTGAKEPSLNVLAYRNLVRGCSLALPAGTAMARKYGIREIKLKPHEPDALWYYILRESELLGNHSGNKLGALGSLIVCSTFAGLLMGDLGSYFNVHPRWKPDDDPLLIAGVDNVDGEKVGRSNRNRRWTLASIIRIAGLPITGQNVRDQDKNGPPRPRLRSPSFRRRRPA